LNHDTRENVKIVEQKMPVSKGESERRRPDTNWRPQLDPGP